MPTAPGKGRPLGATLEQAQKAWQETAVRFMRKSPSRIAYLGNGLGNAASNVIVPGQPNKVYARDSLKSGNYYIVQNRTVQPAINKPVILGFLTHEPQIEQVIDFHYAGYEYSDSASAYNAPVNHGGRHEFGGGDEVFIDSRLVTPGLMRPLNPASMKVYIMPFTYYYNEWNRWAGGSSPDLTSYIPSSGSRYVTIALNPLTNELVLRPGEIYSASAAAFQDIAGGIGSIPPPGADEYPIGAVNLGDNDVTIEWSNTDSTIFDARLHITPPWKKILDRLEQTDRSIGNSPTLPTTFAANTQTENFKANAWAIQNREVNPSAPTAGQSLAWDANAGWWSPSTIAGTGEINTGVNLGTGIELFREKSGVNLNFRTLVAGANTTIGSSASVITISSASTSGETNTAENLGSGIGVYREKTGTALLFKSLSPGNYITIASAASEITIGTEAEQNTAANLGTGIELFREKSGAQLNFRTLIAGTNTTITSATSAVTINSTGGGGGEENLGANLGTGIEVFREKSSVTLNFRTLIAGANTTIASATSAITISGVDTSNSATNLGTGIGVFKETAGNQHQFKTLVGGGNITLASAASTVTISSASTSGESNTGSNLGTGAEVFKEKSGASLLLRTITEGSNIIINENANTIELAPIERHHTETISGRWLLDSTDFLLLETGNGNITFPSALHYPMWQGPRTYSAKINQIDVAINGTSSASAHINFERRSLNSLNDVGTALNTASQIVRSGSALQISSFNNDQIFPEYWLVLAASGITQEHAKFLTATVYYDISKTLPGRLLLETGDGLLLETGDTLLLEN